MRREKVEISNGSGQMLSASIERPDSDEIHAWALYAHCFTCSKNLKATRYLAEALTDNGIALLRFDFTGIGGSEGDFSETTFSSNIDDLLTVDAWMGEELSAPELLIGHSLGGAAMLRAAPRMNAAQALATIAAPYDAAHLQQLLGADTIATIRERGQAQIQLAGRSFVIQQRFLDDLEADQPEDALRDLQLPYLILHSPQDAVVDIDNATELFVRAEHPRSFVSLAGADHLLSDRDDASYSGRVIAAWASRYLSA